MRQVGAGGQGAARSPRSERQIRALITRRCSRDADRESEPKVHGAGNADAGEETDCTVAIVSILVGGEEGQGLSCQRETVPGRIRPDCYGAEEEVGSCREQTARGVAPATAAERTGAPQQTWCGKGSPRLTLRVVQSFRAEDQCAVCEGFRHAGPRVPTPSGCRSRGTGTAQSSPEAEARAKCLCRKEVHC